MGQSPTASCPSVACGESQEDENHFLRCPHPERQKFFQSLFRKLQTYFETRNIDPYLRQLLYQLLAPFMSEIEYQDSDHFPLEYQNLLRNQQALGSKMLTSDHDIFEGLSLADRQQYTNGQLQRFLSFAKPVVQASMSQAHDVELAIQQQRPITAFFDIMD